MGRRSKAQTRQDKIDAFIAWQEQVKATQAEGDKVWAGFTDAERVRQAAAMHERANGGAQ
jgi:hypothetical protein